MAGTRATSRTPTSGVSRPWRLRTSSSSRKTFRCSGRVPSSVSTWLARAGNWSTSRASSSPTVAASSCTRAVPPVWTRKGVGMYTSTMTTPSLSLPPPGNQGRLADDLDGLFLDGAVADAEGSDHRPAGTRTGAEGVEGGGVVGQPDVGGRRVGGRGRVGVEDADQVRPLAVEGAHHLEDLLLRDGVAHPALLRVGGGEEAVGQVPVPTQDAARFQGAPGVGMLDHLPVDLLRHLHAFRPPVRSSNARPCPAARPAPSGPAGVPGPPPRLPSPRRRRRSRPGSPPPGRGGGSSQRRLRR